MTAARRDAPGGALIVTRNRCVAPLDAVVGVEDRRVNDRSEPLAGGVRRIRRNECVDEDLIPLQHLVDEDRRLGRLLRGFDGRADKETE